MSKSPRLIRPIEAADLDALQGMAEAAGIGVTTLPPDRELLAARIRRSVASFAGDAAPDMASYLFALEEPEAGRIIGVSAIDGRVGLDDVWYNYRISNTVNSSRELGVHTQNPTLYLTNDMTNCTELCTLFLDQGWRSDGSGPLLSRCRFLFLAEFPSLFSEKVFAEMRGYSDERGQSPFWDGLGRHFFNMEFQQADRLTGRGDKSFIAELMPKHPVYLNMLEPGARAVVGRVHDNTRPALRMLEAEGFRFNGLVDIFDAGPVIEAFLSHIRAVRESRLRQVELGEDLPEAAGVEPASRLMVSNRSLAQFRVLTVPEGREQGTSLTLTPAEAGALRLESGDQVRVVRLKQQNQGSDTGRRENA